MKPVSIPDLILGIVLALLAVSPTAAQSLADVSELRSEINRIKEQLARAEAMLVQIQEGHSSPVSNFTPAAEPVVAAPEPSPSQPLLRRAPALNTPSKLPVAVEGYRKTAPRFDVLLQGRYDHFEDRTRLSTFFLRKAELGLKGEIVDHIDFSLELDFVRTPVNDPYRRTYIRLSHLPRFHVKVGLEKAPIGLEELTSTGQIPFVERSEVTDRFAAAEELGLFTESTWDRFMFQTSLTNGGRRLYRDDNRHKDVAARLVWAPWPTFSLGVSTLQGRTGPAELDRIRYNVETKVGSNNLRGVQAEYFRAKDAGVWSNAHYVAAFWAAPARMNWLTHVQPVARYEHIGREDEDLGRELRLLTLGVGLLFQENRSKLQINWLTDVRSNSPRKREVRAQFQVEF